MGEVRGSSIWLRMYAVISITRFQRALRRAPLSATSSWRGSVLRGAIVAACLSLQLIRRDLSCVGVVYFDVLNIQDTTIGYQMLSAFEFRELA